MYIFFNTVVYDAQLYVARLVEIEADMVMHALLLLIILLEFKSKTFQFQCIHSVGTRATGMHAHRYACSQVCMLCRSLSIEPLTLVL